MNIKAHRAAYSVAYQEWLGNMEGWVVMHSCDNRNCIQPRHLTLGTKHENALDMSAKGRAPRGERSGKAKLTERDVADIRARWQPGFGGNTVELAAEYGIARNTLTLIANGQRWSHL